MSATHWLDTNVLLRFLLNDHPKMSSAAAALIQRLRLHRHRWRLRRGGYHQCVPHAVRVMP